MRDSEVRGLILEAYTTSAAEPAMSARISKPYDGPTMARCIDAALSRRNAESSDN